MEHIKVFLLILFVVHISTTAAFAAGLYYQLMVINVLTKTFDKFGWLWFILLGSTGMFQMSASPNYAGLLRIDSIWAVALFIKHVLVLLLGLFMIIQTFVLIPSLNRELWKKSPDQSEIKEATKTTSMRRLGLRIELVLFLLILIATGITRAS